MIKVCNVIGCENECVSECLNRFDNKYEFSMRMKSDIGVGIYSSGSMIEFVRKVKYDYVIDENEEMIEYEEFVSMNKVSGKSNKCMVCGSMKGLIRFKRLNEFRCLRCVSRREKFVSRDENIIIVKVGKFMREMYGIDGVKIVYRDGSIKELEKFVWLKEEKWIGKVSEKVWNESNWKFWSMKNWLEYCKYVGSMKRMNDKRLDGLMKEEMLNDLRLYEEELGIKLVK